MQRQQTDNLKRYGGIKLSAALIDISEPFDYEDLSLDEYKELMTMAAIAWNIALQPKERRNEELFGFISKIPEFKKEVLEIYFDKHMENANLQKKPPDSIVLLQMLATLIQRKDQLYPDDDRVVVDYNVTESPTDRHLRVSSLIPDTMKVID